MKYILFLIGFICLVGSCSQNRVSSESDQIRSSIKQDLNPSYLEVDEKDSIPFSEGSNYIFDRAIELNLELFKKNKLFILSRPDVIIGLMDTTGHFLQKITKKGIGPGELLAARSAKAWIGSDGDIYVLTNANAFSLYVYSETGQFKYTTRLFNAVERIYYPKTGFYHMSEKKNGIYVLTLSIGSGLYSPFQAKYYKNASAIAQFTINAITGAIIEVNTKLPIQEYPEIKNGLTEERISWGGRDAIFKEYNDQFFLTFPFSKKVYIYNKQFEKISEITLKTLYLYDPGFSFKMQRPPKDLFDRTYLEHRTYLENAYIKNLQVLDSTLIIQYLAPLKESDYLADFPTKKSIQTKDNWQDFFIKRDQVWLIHDLKTGKEKLIRLSNEHDMATFLDKYRLLVTRNIEGIEDPYIFKYQLKESITDF